MHVIHTWILMNKEYILFYILALSEGHENQANILNTFSTYIYKKHPCMGAFRIVGDRGGHIPLIKTIQIFLNHTLKLQNICLRSPHPGKQIYPSPEKFMDPPMTSVSNIRVSCLKIILHSITFYM